MGFKRGEKRVNQVLADTIAALCRNTLSYASQVNVHGLIGITMDNEDLFLVNISQKIDNTGGTKRQKRNSTGLEIVEQFAEESSSEPSEDQSDEDYPKKKRKRRYRKRKQPVKAEEQQAAATDGAAGLQTSVLSNTSSHSDINNLDPNFSLGIFPMDDQQQNESSFTDMTGHTNTAPTSNTGRNGVSLVKEEIDSDNHDDEELHIVKEEIDSSHSNPGYLFPNVTEALQPSDTFQMGASVSLAAATGSTSTTQSVSIIL